MYKIEKNLSDYYLTFSGLMNEAEIQRWIEDSITILEEETSKSFGVIVDMKDLTPLESKASCFMRIGQRIYKEKGMHRSAVIVNSPATRGQFKAIAFMSGIYDTERYIDASAKIDANDVANKWVKDAIDPYK